MGCGCVQWWIQECDSVSGVAAGCDSRSSCCFLQDSWFLQRGLIYFWAYKQKKSYVEGLLIFYFPFPVVFLPQSLNFKEHRWWILARYRFQVRLTWKSFYSGESPCVYLVKKWHFYAMFNSIFNSLIHDWNMLNYYYKWQGPWISSLSCKLCY